MVPRSAQGSLTLHAFRNWSSFVSSIWTIPRQRVKVATRAYFKESSKMLHHLMVGTWTPPGAIFTFAFDDEALTLRLIHRAEIPHDEPISWMTFNHSRKTIYGASMKKWSSHAVHSPTDIQHYVSHPISGHPLATSKDSNTRAIFVLAAQKPPYNVYGNPFYKYASHGNVFSVDERGGLVQNIQDYEYQESAGVHGMTFDPSESVLYSADMGSNKLWSHVKDKKDGTVQLIGSISAPAVDDHPRWVAVHQGGKYLYLLMEAGNRLAEYRINAENHLPEYTGRVFPLFPDDLLPEKKNYRGDVVFCTQSGKYLIATTRSNTLDIPGWISVYRLSEEGSIEEQICLQPTSSSGGHSNAVSPCPWTDEWFALTDDTVGFIEIYRWQNEKLQVAARCEVHEPGFGMNAIWYD